jgi:hypothetical protein
MNFLPIVERELRVRARGRANYWGRLGVGLVAMVIAVPPLAWTGPWSVPATIGRSIFDGLAGAGFILCCAAALATADSISRERREGTLGLLFLTRIRRFDLLAGKFASNGLVSLLGLVAFLPVLMLPVLAGGVNSGEVWRKGLVLLDVLWLALSAGLWASARGCERVPTVRAALLVVAGLVAVPSLLTLIFPGSRVDVVSPLGAMLRAGDAAYRSSAGAYWVSVGLVHVISWGLLVRAVIRLDQRAEFEDSALANGTDISGPKRAEDRHAVKEAEQRCSYCGGSNDEQATHCWSCGTQLWSEPVQSARPILLAEQRSPIHWLVRRRRGLLPLVWLAGLIGLMHLGLFSVVGRSFGMGLFTYGISWIVGLVGSASMGALFAWAAARFFVHTRRSGELELLLPTPGGAKAMINAQWDVLRRLVVGPVVLMLLPPLLEWGVIGMGRRFGAEDAWRIYFAIYFVVHLTNIVLLVRALCWVGLWFGLRTGVLSRAVIWTVVLVEAPPHALVWVCSTLTMPLLMRGGFVSPFISCGWWARLCRRSWCSCIICGSWEWRAGNWLTNSPEPNPCLSVRFSSRGWGISRLRFVVCVSGGHHEGSKAALVPISVVSLGM